jgi:eukaryotic-like serine/threonine-protein kinase
MSESKGNAEEPEPLLGQTINGRYKIVSLIARGGMGKVFKAEQSALGRVCALKVLSPNYEGNRDPEFHKRFSLEASTAARLSHANTVTIFDYGRDEALDVYYIAMEFLAGRTLHRAIHDEGSIPEARANHIAQQICRSVHEAHALGVVHRDLKPGNVLLCERGEDTDFVKVLDFGLVKDVSGKGQDLTQTGVFMGSPKYMAPEQVTSGEISARTDVYAIGIILYEMLCGKPPFEKKQSMSTLVAHVNEPPPPLAERAKSPVSPEMEAIVMCCLEKSPDARYASMRDLIKALKRASGGDLTETSEGLPRARIDFEAASSRPGDGGSRQGETGSGPGPSGSLSAVDRAALSRKPAPGSAATGGGDSLAPPHAPPTFSGLVRPPTPAYRVYAVALAAALLGGGGAALVLARRSPDLGSQPRVVESVYVPVAVPAAALAVTASNPAAGLRLVRIETDPPGARVSDRGTEVCLSTPCELVWRGEGAKLEHRLLALRSGYKPGTIVVGPDDEKATLRLDSLSGSGDAASPASTASPTTATATAAAAPPADPGPTAAPAALPAEAVAPTAAAILPTAAAAAAAPTAAPAGVMRFEEGMTRPTPLSAVSPAYTREALEARVEGTVIAKCVVTTAGALTGCRIVKGLPHMDQAVLSALAASKYQPATLQGKPVSVDYVFTMRLVLP